MGPVVWEARASRDVLPGIPDGEVGRLSPSKVPRQNRRNGVMNGRRLAFPPRAAATVGAVSGLLQSSLLEVPRVWKTIGVGWGEPGEPGVKYVQPGK